VHLLNLVSNSTNQPTNQLSYLVPIGSKCFSHYYLVFNSTDQPANELAYLVPDGPKWFSNCSTNDSSKFFSHCRLTHLFSDCF